MIFYEMIEYQKISLGLPTGGMACTYSSTRYVAQNTKLDSKRQQCNIKKNLKIDCKM